jgi:hypothetical protein
MGWGSLDLAEASLVPTGVSGGSQPRDAGRDKTFGGEVKRSPPLIFWPLLYAEISPGGPLETTTMAARIRVSPSM